MELHKLLIDRESNILDVNFGDTTTYYADSGLYNLDESSYVMLIRNYEQVEECKKILQCAESLTYQQMQHKTGVKETRSTLHIGPSYTYGDITHPENHNWPRELIKLKGRLETEFLCPLNSTLVNKYEKHQCIPYHADDEDALQTHPSVFSFSVGETRTMVFKHKNEDKLVQFKLFPGTLLIMGGKINSNWLHSIPKHNSYKNTRYNFTFRYLTSSTKKVNNSKILTELESLKLKISNLESNLELDSLKLKLSNLESLIINQKPSYAAVANTHSIPQRNFYLRPHPLGEPFRNSFPMTQNEPPKNLELALFNKDVGTKNEDIVNLINTHLIEENKLNLNDIDSIRDTRNKNGPILIKVNSTKKKNIVLKAKNENLKIHESLSKDKVILRKRIVDLIAKKVISKVWIYRGDVYYILPDSENPIRATPWLLKSLEDASEKDSPSQEV